MKLPTTSPAADEAPRSGSRPWLAWLLGLVAVGALGAAFSGKFLDRSPGEITSAVSGPVAVLPLVHAGDRSDDWVRWGLASMIGEALEQNPGVQVIPTDRLHGVLRRRRVGGEAPADRERGRELAAALGAGLILDGTLQRRPGGVQLEIRLFDALGQELESHRLEGPDALAAADRWLELLVPALATGYEARSIRRSFSRNPFVDRLYGGGLHRWFAGSKEAADEARRYFEIALRDEPSFLQAQVRLAECVRRSGDVSAARTMTQDVLQTAQSRGETKLQASALVSLGRLEALAGNYAAAQAQFEQAHRTFLQLQDRGAQAGVLFELGRLARARGDEAKAEELYVEVLQLQQANGDRLGQVDTMMRIGSLLLAADKLEGAHGVLADARNLASELRDPWNVNRAAASLGEVAWRRGDVSAAIEQWNEALAFSQQRKERQRTLLLGQNLAQALLADGQLKEAEDLLQDQLDLARDLEDQRSEARIALQLARLQLRQGFPFQASDHFERALELDRFIEDRVGMQKVIAWLAYEKASYALAVKAQQDAKRQAGEEWSEEDEEFLLVYQQARKEARRLPVPGEVG